jgi:hypothetical protein
MATDPFGIELLEADTSRGLMRSEDISSHHFRLGDDHAPDRARRDLPRAGKT